MSGKHVLVSAGIALGVSLVTIAMFAHNMLPGFITGGVVIQDSTGKVINPKPAGT